MTFKKLSTAVIFSAFIVILAGCAVQPGAKRFALGDGLCFGAPCRTDAGKAAANYMSDPVRRDQLVTGLGIARRAACVAAPTVCAPATVAGHILTVKRRVDQLSAAGQAVDEQDAAIASAWGDLAGSTSGLLEAVEVVGAEADKS